MLRQRVITALVLAPLALWGIWELSSQAFAIAIGVIFALAAWEWSRLSGLHGAAGRGLFVAVVVALMAGAYPLMQEGNWSLVILLVALMWWVMALLAVLGYPRSSDMWRSAVARGVAGLLILLPAWSALYLLHRDFGPGFVILLMLLIWGADTGAYFAGRAFGRHKLAPKVSPGKTWEGVLGGMLLAIAVTTVLALFWLEPHGGLGGFVLLVVLTIAVSVLGDLVESLFKRIVDLKDSGGLLPGHGGVMDRIDSLTAAAPLFTLGLLWLSK